jgi:UDP-4-amino-4,6-dideoxy-N-acetyl-beta-L-altrosamine transaminase
VIPYGRQSISDADIDSVVDVLRSDFLTQGPVVPRFEKAVATTVGANFGVAVNSATSALHIACLALEVGPGDIVWTSPNTFVASANCARYCGAEVDFVDIDPVSYNMCTVQLRAKLTQARVSGKLPKVVIPVHFAGHPCNMSEIHRLSKEFGFKIVEDASHAIGASYLGLKVGACAHSSITVFSFHPVKIITTGEGGMAMTNVPELAERMRRLRTHGITTDKSLMHARASGEIWNYQQIELGFNYRMTDLQAALGLSQLARLDDFVSARRRIAETYNTQLKSLPIVLPREGHDLRSSYHLYPVRILQQSGKAQRHVFNSLIELGVAANLHYIPAHRHPYYESMGFKQGGFPESEQFHREALSLPIYPELQPEHQRLVIDALVGALA